jgi:hypothetical protein
VFVDIADDAEHRQFFREYSEDGPPYKSRIGRRSSLQICRSPAIFLSLSWVIEFFPLATDFWSDLSFFVALLTFCSKSFLWLLLSI